MPPALQRSTNAARYAVQLALPYRDQALTTVTFVVPASQRTFWESTLAVDGASLLPIVLGQPAMKLQFADPAALSTLLARGDPSQPVIPILGEDWFTPSTDFTLEAARHLERLLSR